MEQAKYSCPMHPDEVSNKPGQCSRCGMNLTKSKKKKRKLIVYSSGEALKLALEEGVYLVKPNVGELSKLAGKEELEAGEIEPVATGRNLKEALQHGVACGTAATMNPGTQLCKTEDVEKVLQAIKSDK